jgi:cell division protein FtsL
MTKANLLLLVGLVGSSLLLVKTSYDSRRLTHALDRAQAEQQTLESERQRLEAERQAQATPLRVERVAGDKLGMRAATAAVTEYVADPAAVPGATR